ncbi:MAG: hypothetical protein R6T85_04225 [Egibacteraceae bacterium]
MAERDDLDQETYDRLIAAGKPERIARAKAKAAAVRKQREATEEPAGGGDASAGDGDAPTGNGDGAPTPAKEPVGVGAASGGPMTAEERKARVAAALAQRDRGEEAHFAGLSPTRRLEMAQPSGTQRIAAQQADKVYTWPHLIGAEFVALLAMLTFVMAFSAFAPAPLQELANPNVTPNPAKAPWYFLGLQELLAYFHPMIAGVTIPGIVGLIGLILLPYLDKNPSVKPENRKTAYALFTMFLVGAATLTLIGSFFRGPGFNWTWPWAEGIWFVL